jgi:hypothetical protein
MYLFCPYAYHTYTDHYLWVVISTLAQIAVGSTRDKCLNTTKTVSRRNNKVFELSYTQ